MMKLPAVPRHASSRRSPLACEVLEDRCTPAVAQAWVATSWALEADNDSSNTISLGDTVNNFHHGRFADAVRGTYGVDAFGTVMEAFAGYAGTLDPDSNYDTISDALANTRDGGAVTLLGQTITVSGGGTYPEAVDLGQGGGTGKTLAGLGVISGPVTIPAGSRLSPGNPISPLTTGTLTLESGAFLRYQISHNYPGSTPERVIVNGDVNLGGAVLELSGPQAAGETWVVIDNRGANPVAGAFTGLPDGAVMASGGTVGVLRYNGGDGNDVVLDVSEALGPFRTRGLSIDPYAATVRPGQALAARPSPIHPDSVPPISAGQTRVFRFQAPTDGLYQIHLQPPLYRLDARFTVRDEVSGAILLGPVNGGGVGEVEQGSVFLDAGRIYRIELTSSVGTAETHQLEVLVNRANIGAFDNGNFYLDTNGSYKYEPGIDVVHYFGQAGDQPVVGSWGGRTEDWVGVYRGGMWYLDGNGNGHWDGEGTDLVGYFGAGPTDRAVAGDFDGDNRDEIGVFRDGMWYIDLNHTGRWDDGDVGYSFGEPGDQPVVGDWNGDGAADLGVRRGVAFYLDSDGSRGWTAGDTRREVTRWDHPAPPVAGDWPGDGRDRLGEYDGNLFRLDFASPSSQANYGAVGSLPVVGQWKDPAGWPPVVDPFAPTSYTFTSTVESGTTAIYRDIPRYMYQRPEASLVRVPITTVPANVMAEGPTVGGKSTLFASFPGYGTYQIDLLWHGGPFSRVDVVSRELTTVPARTMDTDPAGNLYASFDGYGTFKLPVGGAWQLVTTAVANALAAVDGNLVYGSYLNSGTYSFDARQAQPWTLVTPVLARAMEAVPTAAGPFVYASFDGYGTFGHAFGAWGGLTPLVAESLVGYHFGVAGGFVGSGTLNFAPAQPPRKLHDGVATDIAYDPLVGLSVVIDGLDGVYANHAGSVEEWRRLAIGTPIAVT